jgi:hypothetical protein
MEFKLFGLRFRLEVVIITIVLGILLGAHLFCGCCRYPITDLFSFGKKFHLHEGYTVSANDQANVAEATKDIISANKQLMNQKNGVKEVMTKLSEGLGLLGDGDKKNSGDVAPHEESIAEGMQTMGAGLNDTNNADVASSWITKAVSYSSELGYMDSVKKGMAVVGTPVPLPEGELFFFSQNQFKPECCPGPYSTSTGCACMTSEQWNYLNSRGGNRTGDTEF